MQEEPRGIDSRERILRTAAQLFAKHGFHGVSTREIAAASQLNISTVNYHVGRKQELYKEVFRRLSKTGREIEALLETTDPNIVYDREALLALLDRLIDMFIWEANEFPDARRLWVRVALDDPEQFADLEAELSRPFQKRLYQLLQRAAEVGTTKMSGHELRLAMMGFDGALDVYFNFHPLDENFRRLDPYAPDQLAALKRFLQRYVRFMLNL